jgi:hypothetical protein
MSLKNGSYVPLVTHRSLCLVARQDRKLQTYFVYVAGYWKALDTGSRHGPGECVAHAWETRLAPNTYSV